MPIRETKSARLKLFAVSLLAMLSLFASSVLACACSHHQEQTPTETASCHEHSAEANHHENHDGDAAETIQTAVSESACFCVQTAPKVFAKSENVKVEKQIQAIPAVLPTEIIVVTQKIISAQFDFTKPPYLSDSFYNLSPGRAPPRS